MSTFEIMRQRRFFPLFWTQFFNALNDNFLKNALVILVTFREAQVWGMPYTEVVALAGGVFILPFFLFSALAGQLADKHDKMRIIRFIKAAEILIMILAAYGLLNESPGFLMFVLFLMGLHSTFFGPIKYSILPQHLSPQQVVTGNALVEAGTFVAILAGTIIGGSLIGLDNGLMVVSVGLLLIAVLGFVTCLWIPSAPPADPTLHVRYNPITPTIDILRFAQRSREVYLAILAISWFWLFGAAMLSLFPGFGKDILHGDEHMVTLFLAMFSIGIAAGSLICGRLSRESLRLDLISIGAAGMSITAALLGLLTYNYVPPSFHNVLEFANSWRGFVISLDLFLLSVCGGLFIVPLYTLMLQKSEAQLRSRVVAANNILNALFMVVASLLLIALFRYGLTIPQIFIFMALSNVSVAYLCKRKWG